MFAPVNSTQIKLEVGAKIKKLSNWSRSYHGHDFEQIQLGAAGEVLLYTYDLFHLEFRFFFAETFWQKFNTFSRSCKPIVKFNTFSILSIPRGNPVSYFGQNVWKYRLTNTVTVSFNAIMRQMTEISLQRKRPKCLSAISLFINTNGHNLTNGISCSFWVKVAHIVFE